MAPWLAAAGLIVVLWRGGLRVQEALALGERDPRCTVAALAAASRFARHRVVL